MAISLNKGGNLSLQIDPSLNQVLIGLGWDARKQLMAQILT